MAIKPLPSQEYLRQILDYNEVTGIFTWRLIEGAPKERNIIWAGRQAGYIDKRGYVFLRFNGGLYLGHRVAWKYFYGSEPPREIDHINLNKSDNRITNLRSSSHSENSMNRGATKKNKTGYKGVFYNNQARKYNARIRVNGKIFHLGTFSNPEEAHKAYCVAAEKYHGEFARVA